MSVNFSHDRDAELNLAGHMRAHGDEIGTHGETLSAHTQGRVGTGPLGEVAETAVRRMTVAFGEGVSSAFKKFFHDTADVVEQNLKRLDYLDLETKNRHDSIGHHPHDEPQGGPHGEPPPYQQPPAYQELPPYDQLVGSRTAGEIVNNVDAAGQDPHMRNLVGPYSPFGYGDETHRDFNRNWGDGKGGVNWPPNNGEENFTRTPGFTLQPGTLLDRFGRPTGSYLSPHGTLLSERALPPTSLGSAEDDFDYHVYEVVKPFDVTAAFVAPWFEQEGGGVQYRLEHPDGTPVDLQSFVDSGHLRKRAR